MEAKGMTCKATDMASNKCVYAISAMIFEVVLSIVTPKN